MTGRQRISKEFLKIAKDKHGNFAIMAALCLPVLLAIGGAAFEISRALQIKSDMQAVADSAVLSATTKARLLDGKITEQEMIAAANDYIAASMFTEEMTEEERKDFFAGIALGASKTKSDKGEEFSVQSNMSYNMQLSPLLSFIGHKTLPISVESRAASSVSAGSALSLYLVLDRSGSMSFKTDTVDKSKTSCKNYDEDNWADQNNVKSTKPCYVTKIASLKLAVNYLTDTLQENDPEYQAGGKPESKVYRTGAVAYNDEAFAAQALEWGGSATLTHVKAIPEMPTGGTSAKDALNKAFADLKSSNSKEGNAHKSVGNERFERFIIFMTDGEMTGESANWKSSEDRDARRVCDNAKQDGITIFTVAFMAPQKGRDLLKACASSETHYYAPDKMTDLVAAFGEIARKASSKISRLTH